MSQPATLPQTIDMKSVTIQTDLVNPKGLIDQLDGEDSVSEQIRGPVPGSGRPPRVGRLRGWPESSEILVLVYSLNL